MNRNILYQTLIRAARTDKVGQGVPPGFEARVLSAIHRVEPNESLRRWASVFGKRRSLRLVLRPQSVWLR